MGPSWVKHAVTPNVLSSHHLNAKPNESRPALHRWRRAPRAGGSSPKSEALCKIDSRRVSVYMVTIFLGWLFLSGRTQIAAGSRTVLGILGSARLVNQVTGKLRLLWVLDCYHNLLLGNGWWESRTNLQQTLVPPIITLLLQQRIANTVTSVRLSFCHLFSFLSTLSSSAHSILLTIAAMSAQATSPDDRSQQYLHTHHSEDFKASYDDLIDEYSSPYASNARHQTFAVSTSPHTHRRGNSIPLQKAFSKHSDDTYDTSDIVYPPVMATKEADDRSVWQKVRRFRVYSPHNWKSGLAPTRVYGMSILCGHCPHRNNDRPSYRGGAVSAGPWKDEGRLTNRRRCSNGHFKDAGIPQYLRASAVNSNHCHMLHLTYISLAYSNLWWLWMPYTPAIPCNSSV